MATTEAAPADLLVADLTGLDLVAITVDGVHVADHLCVAALGDRHRRRDASAGAAEGSPENTTVVRVLLVGLGERGLDVTLLDQTHPSATSTDPGCGHRWNAISRPKLSHPTATLEP